MRRALSEVMIFLIITSVPTKPILLKRTSQAIPEGGFEVVEPETVQGLVLTRMVVIENLNAVIASRCQFQMNGGKGDIKRECKQFNPETEKNAQVVIDAVITSINPDDAFARVSGDVSFLKLAAGVKLDQLGMPSGSIRYGTILGDDTDVALRGDVTYVRTVPVGLYNPGGYFSVTLYGADNKLLIPNALKIYDRNLFFQSRATTEQQPSHSVRMEVDKMKYPLAKTSMETFVRTYQHPVQSQM